MNDPQDTRTNAQAVIDTATRAATPQPLSVGDRFYSLVSPDGSIKVIDLEDQLDRHREAPRRKAGKYAVDDAASFLAYLGKHGDADSEVWADSSAATVTGVLDGNTGDGARFEQHRVVYTARPTDAWKAWLKLDGQLVDQSTLAEHLEDRALDIIEPSAADMLELAQTFTATIGVNFESSKRLSSGERQLEYREQVDAKAGHAGRLDIPEKFVLAVQPFEGSEKYKVTVRLRYRITNGALRIGYRIERPEDVARDAFAGVVTEIQTALADSDTGPALPVLFGRTA